MKRHPVPINYRCSAKAIILALDQLLQVQINKVIFTNSRITPDNFNLTKYLQFVQSKSVTIKSLLLAHFYFYNKEIIHFNSCISPGQVLKNNFIQRNVTGYPELNRKQF